MLLPILWMSKLKAGRLKAVLKVTQLNYFIAPWVYTGYKTQAMWLLYLSIHSCSLQTWIYHQFCARHHAQCSTVLFNISDTTCIFVSSLILACSLAAPGIDMRKIQTCKHNFRGLTSLLFLCSETVQHVCYHMNMIWVSNATREPTLNNILCRRIYWKYLEGLLLLKLSENYSLIVLAF